MAKNDLPYCISSHFWINFFSVWWLQFKTLELKQPRNYWFKKKRSVAWKIMFQNEMQEHIKFRTRVHRRILFSWQCRTGSWNCGSTNSMLEPKQQLADMNYLYDMTNSKWVTVHDFRALHQYWDDSQLRWVLLK